LTPARPAADNEFFVFLPMARKRTDDKRQRILQAAVKVFARKGYFASRVSEIARRAEVADGTIYLYFRGKEDILVSLFDEVMSEHVERAREEMQAVEGASARLRVLAEHHLRVLGADRDLAVVFQVELRQSTKFMERFTASWLARYFDLVGSVIEQGQREGTLRADLPRKLVTKAFFGTLDELVTSWVIGRKDYDLALLAAPAVDLLLRGASEKGTAAPGRRALAAVPGRGGR
jgi:TetR/AcrR family fatty acid metabolism transcriptional regulator